MGDVYRARDTRLERLVAIKVLPRDFAGDDTRARRFQREAKSLATLNHSNIAQIFAVDRVDDVDFIAMELVPGESLDERLARGPLPVNDALRVARDIAEGLEVAHEAGVIHRDLKPANVVVTPDGTAKILDFGLAKPTRELSSGSTTLSAVTLDDGRVVGTPTYMSPEQIDGKPIDRRVDVWAFGCVLYECLTGRRAFEGESLGSLFAAISMGSVDMNRVAHAPTAVQTLLERCLRKDPKQRLRDMGDARVALEDIQAGRTPAAPRSPSGTPSGVFVLLAGAILGGIVGWTLMPRGEGGGGAPPSRYAIALPLPPQPGAPVLDCPAGSSPPLALTPDGATVVFTAMNESGIRQLYERGANDAGVRAIPGTEGAESPFLSPDGKYAGFATEGGGLIRTVSLTDGSMRVIEEEGGLRGASWGPDGMIVFGRQDFGLFRTSATGEGAEQLTRPGPNDQDHRWPQVLPGGRHILFTANLKDSRFEPRILSLKTGKWVTVPVQGALARYMPGVTGDRDRGFLLYMRIATGDLWAVRVDIESGQTLGDPARVMRGIHVSELGNPHIALSAAGTIVYEPRRPAAAGKRLLYVDRDGAMEELHTGMGYEFPRMSPDGHQVVFANHTVRGTHDICAVDRRTGKSVKLTAGGNYVSPIWSPDGEHIACGAFGDQNAHRFRLGASKPTVILDRPGWQLPLEWLPDGQLLFEEYKGDATQDLGIVDLDTLEVRQLIFTADTEEAGTVSPDGRWLAYVSDKSGRKQVYLRAYPQLGLDIPVSVDGGVEPVWSPEASGGGRELFFRHHRSLMVTLIPDDESPIPEPRKLFDGNFVPGFMSRPNYDVIEGGQRFIMVEGNWGLTAGRLEVCLRFQRELEQQLPRVDE